MQIQHVSPPGKHVNVTMSDGNSYTGCFENHNFPLAKFVREIPSHQSNKAEDEQDIIYLNIDQITAVHLLED